MWDHIAQILLQQWIFDVHVMSNQWMYWPFCIPIILYMVFFFIKWVVLTAPAWLPLAIVIAVSRRD